MASSDPTAGGPGIDLLRPRPRIRPHCADWPTTWRSVRWRHGSHEADEAGAVSPEIRKALAAADLLRITVGEEWGGMGLGDVEASIVLEEICRADVSSAICCRLTFNGPPRASSASALRP